MRWPRLLAAAFLLLAAGGAAWAVSRLVDPGLPMSETGAAFVKTLSDEQRAAAVLPYDTPRRVEWHFIPKPERKGLQVKHMSPEQREAAHALLRAALSEVGYDKAVKVMALEEILAELEKTRTDGPIRDPERYYFTLFGEPTTKGLWGLSVEGHHLSLNFVIQEGRVISSTPAFYGANPSVLLADGPAGLKKGDQVLRDEEQLAFDLLASLGEKQKSQALIADKAPADIRAAGEPQPPQFDAAGLAASELEPPQQEILRKLIAVYAAQMPAAIAEERLARIEEAGFEKVCFAWAGAEKPGVGHYYIVQGPTFLIEFVNTQPDAAGNPARHIHCAWRDPTGDFGIPRPAK